MCTIIGAQTTALDHIHAAVDLMPDLMNLTYEQALDVSLMLELLVCASWSKASYQMSSRRDHWIVS